MIHLTGAEVALECALCLGTVRFQSPRPGVLATAWAVSEQPYLGFSPTPYPGVCTTASWVWVESLEPLMRGHIGKGHFCQLAGEGSVAERLAVSSCDCVWRGSQADEVSFNHLYTLPDHPAEGHGCGA